MSDSNIVLLGDTYERHPAGGWALRRKHAHDFPITFDSTEETAHDWRVLALALDEIERLRKGLHAALSSVVWHANLLTRAENVLDEIRDVFDCHDEWSEVDQQIADLFVDIYADVVDEVLPSTEETT